MADQAQTHASSTGQNMTGSVWLDAHFEADRAEYEAQVRAVGIQPGWRVLDAGCGSGSFLPWLADLVGPTGQIAAFDLAPDNIAIVESRLAEWQLVTPIETQVGSVFALPYPDASFDAVWCANTTQYFTDVELGTMLAEMRRVVRPGGLVALKEFDATLQRCQPAPIGLMFHGTEAIARAGRVQPQGCLRASTLPAWLRKAGFVAITRRATLIEHTAPLSPVERVYIDSYFVALARGAFADLAQSEADRAWWTALRESGSIDRLLDDADFSFSEGNMLAIGQVPEREGKTA